MHIPEGILSPPVLGAGAALTAAGTWLGLRKVDLERVPQVAILSSAFFVASLIHVKIGGSSAHLVLCGLVGLILGWAAFPALLVALFLQSVLFGFGGFTTLGVNTFNAAAPAVLTYLLFNRLVRTAGHRTAVCAGFVAGAFPILLVGFLVALSLIGTEESFSKTAYVIAAAHVPVMIIEGLVTASVVAFLRRVRPEVLEAPLIEEGQYA